MLFLGWTKTCWNKESFWVLLFLCRLLCKPQVSFWHDAMADKLPFLHLWQKFSGTRKVQKTINSAWCWEAAVVWGYHIHTWIMLKWPQRASGKLNSASIEYIFWYLWSAADLIRAVNDCSSTQREKQRFLKC